MFNFCSHHRMPRADIDAIADAESARLLVTSMMSTPMRHETITVLLDHEHRGITVFRVLEDPDARPDAIFDVAEVIVGGAHLRDHVGAVIMASIRPGGSDELDDAERWLSLDDQFESAGIELVEWFVVGRRISCPRSLVGDPARFVA